MLLTAAEGRIERGKSPCDTASDRDVDKCHPHHDRRKNACADEDDWPVHRSLRNLIEQGWYRHIAHHSARSPPELRLPSTTAQKNTPPCEIVPDARHHRELGLLDWA
jgi:hypothetical protein